MNLQICDRRIALTPGPDLNPVDYKTWDNESTRQKRRMEIFDAAIIDMWVGVEPSVIDDGIDQWCRRLHDAVEPQEDILNILRDTN